MRKYFLFTIIFFSLTSQLYSQNWFPLEVGNKWQYISIDYGGSLIQPDTSYYNTSLFYNEVVSDTTINSNLYYKLSQYPDNWFRFSLSEQKIFSWLENEDKLIMDFNLPVGSSFISFIPNSWSVGVFANVIGGDILLFDTLYTYKGYRWSIAIDGSFDESYKYIPNYGITLDSLSYFENLSLTYQEITLKLVQAKISGNIYRGNEIPEIVVNPITSILDSNFNLNFNVSHPYNIMFPAGSSFNGLNFIDTVYLHSFYSRLDSIVHNQPISAINISETETWNVNTTLNMNLMRNDFQYYYKIEAIDKGMLPQHSFSPDTGYYIAIWDTTSAVKIQSEVIGSFDLSQNYPNPFNPTTKINYQIQEIGFVTLKVYDVLGNEVATIVNEEKPIGSYEVEFNSRGLIHQTLPSGIYFYRLQAGSFVRTKKMLLMK